MFHKIFSYIKTVLFIINLIGSFFLVWCLALIGNLFKYMGIRYVDELIVDLAKNILISSLVLVCPNTKLILSGQLDKFYKCTNQPAIVICNHQTYFDWVYIWLLAQKVHKAGDLNILLKSALKKLPFLGPNLEKAGFLLLERNWEIDSSHIDNYMDYFVQNKDNKWLLLFPEGTTRHEITLAKSKAYAKKTDRPILDNVLLPHSTGFAALIEKLYYNQYNCHANVFDITMQFSTYNGEYPTDLVFGGTFTAPGIPHIYTFTTNRYPIECHMHIDVYSIEELVNQGNKEDINTTCEHFLDNSYTKKDEEMNYFIKNQCFDDNWTSEKEIVNYNYITRTGKIFLISVGIIVVKISYDILMSLAKFIISFL